MDQIDRICDLIDRFITKVLNILMIKELYAITCKKFYKHVVKSTNFLTKIQKYFC